MIKFHSPSNFLLNGPTGSGKTTWLSKLIENKDILFDQKIGDVHYYYGEWQPIFDKLEREHGVIFHKGIPLENDIKLENDHQIIVLDDLQDQVSENKDIQNIFTRGSHHKKLNVFYLSQNLFYQGKCSRNIGLNCHYFILFKNPRDSGQVSVLGKQMVLPNLISAYKKATKEPYSYLVLDMSPTLDDPNLSVRSKNFPSDTNVEIYK